MKLGISSYTYGWAVGVEGDRPTNALSARDLIDRAAGFGVRVLQICDNLPAATYDEESVEAIVAHAAKRGVQIEVGTRGIAVDHVRRFAGIAKRLGSPILRVVVDAREDHPSEKEVVQRLALALPDLAEANVILAIENHDRFRAKMLAAIVKELNSPFVGICLDTVNSFGALEGPEVVVETLGPYVVNLHLKDFAVKRFPHLMGFTVEGRPAGHGMLDVPWLIAKLKEFRRDPNAIIELWTPPESTAEETIRKEAEWASMSVAAVREWIKD